MPPVLVADKDENTASSVLGHRRDNNHEGSTFSRAYREPEDFGRFAPLLRYEELFHDRPRANCGANPDKQSHITSKPSRRFRAGSREDKTREADHRAFYPTNSHQKWTELPENPIRRQSSPLRYIDTFGPPPSLPIRYDNKHNGLPNDVQTDRMRSSSPSPSRFPKRTAYSSRHATVHDEGVTDEDENESSNHSRVFIPSNPPSAKSTDDGHCSLVRRPRAPRDLLDEIEELRLENEQLKRERRIATPQPAHPASSYKIFHFIEESCYLDEPEWRPGNEMPSLRANNSIRNVGHYLDQHPEIAFAVYKTYSSKVPRDLTKIETKDGIFLKPKPLTQNLSLISPTMIEAMEEFVDLVPGFDYFFPHFNPHRDIKAPYLFMYYCTPYTQDILTRLDTTSRLLMTTLDECIQETHGFEHTSAVVKFAKGRGSKTLFKYLIRPGNVLVKRAGPNTRAYLATDWAKGIPEPDEGRDEDYDEWGDYTRQRLSRRKPKEYDAREFQWKVAVWSWSFDRRFYKAKENLVVTLKASDDSEIISIDELDIMPIQYANPDVRRNLEKRGTTFWQLRHRKLISYQSNENGELNKVSERHMVDIHTYKMLHPRSIISTMKFPSSLSPEAMESNEPPGDRALLLFPPTIPVILFVDQISDVDWNKQAFKDLVVDDETKELVQALVMNQLELRKSTDVIQGKGNGLILLLHGGPGTGKTFTAEGVAEFAEKPLLRVTCGDVGTEAEEVERRLQWNFRLVKIWDFVLPDEADFFLEERDMKDLNRNALVSVFLRELEYHEGFLILTSNRVGTFDEAFKSRIQLALHYDNLGASQRRKIWCNLLTGVKTLDEASMDFEDTMDHLDELSQSEMNGREIRNAITTARQLAQFKEKALCYAHLKHVINVSGKFGKYLRDLRNGLTEDDLKRDEGLRLTYAINKKASKESPF